MSLTLRTIRNTSFPALYKRFLLNDTLSHEEKTNLLSIAIIMLNSDNKDIQRLGYRIIVIYSNQYHDYAPLYEVSINQGLYPITKFIDQFDGDNERRSFYIEFNTSFLENFKSDNIYYSWQQYLLNQIYSNKNDESMSVVAPTSYGKSELIIKTITENVSKNICIITPTKALLAQTRYRILNAKVEWVDKVVVHPEMYNDSDPFCVAVLTQERIFRLLKENPHLYFDYVIIDEAHELLDGSKREELLASVIIVLNKRNRSTAFKFLTPFISNENNLKLRHTTYVLSTYKIDEYVKTERYYLYDIRGNSGLHLYDQFINEWVCISNEPKSLTSIQFIEKHCAKKNIIYFNKPTDIELFANEMCENLGDIKLSPQLIKAIDHISEYISPEYTLVKCLKKGVLYHHGSVPDTVRSYIEHLYVVYPEIKYVITSSTLLEGVNLPAIKLFMMDNRKWRGYLPHSALKNLVGRVCRFNEVFDKENGSLEYLEPKVYFIYDNYYRDKTNIKKYISDIMRVDKVNLDEVDNILLENTPVTEMNKGQLTQAQELIENFEPNTIQNYQHRHAITEIGKICIQNNITEIDVFACESQLEDRINKYKLTHGIIEDGAELLNTICSIFLPLTLDSDSNNGFLRFRNVSTQNYYKMFLSWKLQSLPFNQMISHILSYWKKVILQKEDSIIYVGRWGELTHNSGYQKLWIDIRTKNHSQLINLAIVRIKEEQDFIDNTIMKFVEVLNELGLVKKDLYLILKYGTSNPTEIVLIKNGVSLSLTQLLMEKYQDCLTVNVTTDTIEVSSDLVEKMEVNNENQILIYEAKTNIF